VHRLQEDAIQVGLVVVLRLEEEAEHLVTLHALEHFLVPPNVAMEEVDARAQELLLQGVEMLLSRLPVLGSLPATVQLVIRHPLGTPKGRPDAGTLGRRAS